MKNNLKNVELSPEPVLIFTNKGEVDRHIHLIRDRLIPILNRVKTEFLKLKLGPMTNEYLNDILFGNFELIRDHVPANKLADLFKTCKELKHPWNLEFEIVKDFVSVDDTGEIVLTDESIQAIREFDSIFAITTKGAELFELHKTAANALNEFYQLAKENIEPTTESLAELFLFSNKGEIIPAPLEYDCFHYVRQQEPQKH